MKNFRKIPPTHKEISILEFARFMRNKYGKGIVFFGFGQLSYILPSHSDFNQQDKMAISMLRENDYLISSPVSQTMCNTMMISSEHPYMQQKIIIIKNWEITSEELLYK